MARLSPRVLGDACYKNGLIFQGLAEVAEEQGNFGHAYSLTILGWEEFAKCLIYRMVEVGLMTFELDNPPPQAILLVDRHILNLHRQKHVVVTLSLFGMEVQRAVGGAIPSTWPAHPPPTPATIEAITPEHLALVLPAGVRPDDLPSLATRIEANPALRAALVSLVGKARSWDHARNRGFYVDDRKRGMGVPWDVTGSELSELKGLFDPWFGFNQRMLEGFPAELVDPLRTVFAKAFDPAKIGRKIQLCTSCAKERGLGLPTEPKPL